VLNAITTEIKLNDAKGTVFFVCGVLPKNPMVDPSWFKAPLISTSLPVNLPLAKIAPLQKISSASIVPVIKRLRHCLEAEPRSLELVFGRIFESTSPMKLISSPDELPV